MHKLAKLFLSVILLFSVMSTPILASSENSIYQDDQIEKSIQFRKEFGLNLDISTFAKSNEQLIQSSFGVLLTKKEENELISRIKEQNEKIPLIKKQLEAYGFDGVVYIDQSNGGIINIGIKNDVEKLGTFKNTFNELFTNSSQVKFFPVLYSEQDLNNYHELIWNESEVLFKDKIIGVSTDIINQSLTIYLDETDNNIIESIKKQYPKIPLKFEKSDNNNGDHARDSKLRPIEAGIKITNTDNNNLPCSVGFQATYSTSKVLITAGHCGNDFDYFSQGGDNIGYIISKAQSGNIDAAIVPISDSNYSKYLYKDSSKDTQLTGTESTSNETIGQAVCLSGGISGTSCSTLLSKNESFYDDNGTKFTNFRKSGYTSQSGDSGGTVYNGTTIYGVHKGSYNNGKVYTHVSYIMSQFSLSY